MYLVYDIQLPNNKPSDTRIFELCAIIGLIDNNSSFCFNTTAAGTVNANVDHDNPVVDGGVLTVVVTTLIILILLAQL